jgi:predicted RNA-binding protein with PIN domain
MWTLVDGYNVLFALGLVPVPVKEGDLQRARVKLLSLLAEGLGEEAAHCTVVFDATHAPPRSPSDTVYRGIEVRFTKRREEADDLIVWLIQQCSAPKLLTVISSDHYLVEAARRRRATSVKADRFLEWLERQKQTAAPETSTTTMSPEERAGWLAEFGHLDREFRDDQMFPEQGWQERFHISEEDDLEDIRRKHRLKKKDE